jgi:hypothetical protein
MNPSERSNKRINPTRFARGLSAVRSVHQFETVVGFVDDGGR